MNRLRAGQLLVLLLVAGCGQAVPPTSLSVIGQRTVTVAADDPFIEMEDGTRIRVDGVPPGQSTEIKLTKYKDANDQILFDAESVDEGAVEKHRFSAFGGNAKGRD